MKSSSPSSSSSSSVHHLMDRSGHSHTSASFSPSFSLAGTSAASDDSDNSFHFSELAITETTSSNSTTTTSVSFRRPILQNKNGSFSSSSSSIHQQSARYSLDEPLIKKDLRYSVQAFDDLFHDDDEIAQFQHEVWCKECGLDPKRI